MKITRNTTVEQLKGFIGANVAEVKKQDKNLFDQISYTDKAMKKDPKSVKKADLVQLAKDIMTLLGDTVKEVATPVTLTPVAENSTKPVAKLSAKGGAKKSAEKAEDNKEPEKKKAVPTASGEKKPTTGKKDEKKSIKKPVPEVATASSFPETLTIGDESYELAHDITDMDKLHEASDNDEEIIFAFYWSKSQIKQFNYGSGLLPAPKDGFKDNLDLSTLLYVSDEKKVCFSLSMYTENLYQVMPDAFEEIEGVRYSMGIEYQIYRAAK